MSCRMAAGADVHLNYEKTFPNFTKSLVLLGRRKDTMFPNVL